MALKRPKGSSGTVVVLEHTSKVLKGNALGDPHVRKAWCVACRRSTTKAETNADSRCCMTWLDSPDPAWRI